MHRLQRQLTNCSIRSIPFDAVENTVLAEVRERLRQIHKEHPDWIHELDMQKLIMDSRYLNRFLQRSGNDVEKAVKVTLDTLKWRIEKQLPGLEYESFPREFYDRGAVFLHGHDRRGHLVIYGRAKMFVKCDEFKEMMDRFAPFVYYKGMDMVVTKGEHCGYTVVLDVRGVSIAQFDLAYGLEGIDIICNKLPSVLRKVIMYEMPWLCRPLLKALVVFLPEEWRRSIYQCAGNDIFKHIEADSFPTIEQMRSPDFLPFDVNNCKSLADFTPEEMKRIGLKPEKKEAYLKVLETMRKIDEKKSK